MLCQEQILLRAYRKLQKSFSYLQQYFHFRFFFSPAISSNFLFRFNVSIPLLSSLQSGCHCGVANDDVKPRLDLATVRFIGHLVFIMTSALFFPLHLTLAVGNLIPCFYTRPCEIY